MRKLRTRLVLLSATPLLAAGGCLPPDYFASLAGDALSLTMELVLGTAVQAAIDDTSAGADDAARRQP